MGRIGLRLLVAGHLPLAVASLDGSQEAARVGDALTGAGLATLPAFQGHELPRGARVGFELRPDALVLVDERGDALLQAPRDGVDRAWRAAATRLKGTMLVLVDAGRHPDADLPVAELAGELDELARAGHLHGAIVGVVEERPGLPLVF